MDILKPLLEWMVAEKLYLVIAIVGTASVLHRFVFLPIHRSDAAHYTELLGLYKNTTTQVEELAKALRDNTKATARIQTLDKALSYILDITIVKQHGGEALHDPTTDK